jgi:hypothetical protein
MSIAKSKERAASPTDSVIIAATPMVLAKDTFFRVTDLDIFAGDRKKFKIYESQCRMYLWADRKRGEWRNMKTIANQTLFMTLRLRGEAFARLEFYII